MGGIGMIGSKPVYNAVMSADLLLMVGTDYPYSDYLPKRPIPEASVSCVAAIRPGVGVKPTCRDRSTDAVDPKRSSASPKSGTARSL